MRELCSLFRHTGGFRRFVLLTALRCPFDALQTLLQAGFLWAAVQAIGQSDTVRLTIACGAYGLGSLLLYLYNGTIWSVYAAYVARWAGSVGRCLFHHLCGLSLQQIEARSSGEWMTRLNADVQAASAMLNQPIHLPHAAVSAINIVVSCAVLLWMNPAILGLILLFVIPHLLLVQLVLARPMTGLSLSIQQATDRCTAGLQPMVECASTAILYDAREFLLDRFRQSSLRLLRENLRLRHRAALGGALLPLLGMGGYLLLLYVGGGWIAAGKLTFGELVAAFQYRGGVLLGAMMLASSLMNMKTALAGVRRVNETMAIPVEE